MKKAAEEDKYTYIGLEHLDSGSLQVTRYGSDVAPIGEKLIMKEGDISEKGIMMTGGGCLIHGMDKLLEKRTGLKVTIAEDAVSCVAKGTGQSLEHMDVLKDTLLTENIRTNYNVG